jgi:hypothetical protein
MQPFFEDYLNVLSDHLANFRAAIAGVSQNGLDWVPGPDMNSLAVLIVHTCGSGRYWVGDICMADPSGRIRSAEFETHGMDETELIQHLENLEHYVHDGLGRLSLADLEKPAPVQPQRSPADTDNGIVITIGWALLHALEHTAMHVGHAQITRQLWDMQD